MPSVLSQLEQLAPEAAAAAVVLGALISFYLGIRTAQSLIRPFK
jgi:hypothetical protein